MDNKEKELQVFLDKADEMINSKVILADIKIVGLLRAIAASETIVAIVSMCLADFDYRKSIKDCFKNSGYNSRGEFIPPQNTKESIALTFNILMELDNKTIDLNEFIQEYFYESGSYFESYKLFIDRMIKPFRADIKLLMEGVMNGKFADPAATETVNKEETKPGPYNVAMDLVNKARESAEKLSISEEEKEELLMIIDTFLESIGSGDIDAIHYTFISYKYAARLYKKAKMYVKEIKELLA